MVLSPSSWLGPSWSVSSGAPVGPLRKISSGSGVLASEPRRSEAETERSQSANAADNGVAVFSFFFGGRFAGGDG